MEVVEHRPEDRSCPKCGSEMVEIGKEVRRTLKMEPARFWIQEDVYYTYACKVCEKETGDSVIVNTPKKPAVLPGSFASPEAIAPPHGAEVCDVLPIVPAGAGVGTAGVEAFTAGDVPLAAARGGGLACAHLPRAAQGTAETGRPPRGRDHAAGAEGAGEIRQSKSYMWLYRTGGDAEHPIVLYDYRPDRKAKNAEEFLEGFSGYLHADGYQGYHKLRPDIRVVGCWAHARRKFDEAVKSLPKKEQAGCTALEGTSLLYKAICH